MLWCDWPAATGVVECDRTAEDFTCQNHCHTVSHISANLVRDILHRSGLLDVMGIRSKHQKLIRMS